ncbi:hypothetical protein HDV00_002819 [Rhizophlyctis rosea]|nr:hypothetical protein HDV00_002819 [Rhizophlyctis rosea]
MGLFGAIILISLLSVCVTRCTLFTLGALFVGFKHFKKCAAAEGWEGKSKKEKKEMCKKMFRNFMSSDPIPNLRTHFNSWYNTNLDPLITSLPHHTLRELPNSTYLLEVDVAGIRKSDLIISVLDEERAVLVKGKTSSGEKDVNGNEVEREVDARFEFPRDADVGGVEARVVDGVLRVEAAKKVCEGRRIYVD